MMAMAHTNEGFDHPAPHWRARCTHLGRHVLRMPQHARHPAVRRVVGSITTGTGTSSWKSEAEQQREPGESVVELCNSFVCSFSHAHKCPPSRFPCPKSTQDSRSCGVVSRGLLHFLYGLFTTFGRTEIASSSGLEFSGLAFPSVVSCCCACILVAITRLMNIPHEDALTAKRSRTLKEGRRV